MSKKISVSDLPEFDLAQHLKSGADIAAYITMVIVIFPQGGRGGITPEGGFIAKALGASIFTEADRPAGMSFSKTSPDFWLRTRGSFVRSSLVSFFRTPTALSYLDDVQAMSRGGKPMSLYSLCVSELSGGMVGSEATEAAPNATLEI